MLNGGYGAIGNTAFKFFDLRIAEAITLGGQLSIKWISKKLDEYFNDLLKTEGVEYVVYIDTDSNYICCDKLVERVCPDATDDEKTEFLNKAFEKKILPFISECYEELAEYLNCIENRMFMKREIISPTAIWTKKKRYTAIVTDSEGVRYNEPELKVMGLEAVRSEYPRMSREALKRCYKIALTSTNEELVKEVELFRTEYYKLPLEEISFATSCNNMEEYAHTNRIYKKGTPIGVKAALLHNHHISKMGLEKDYQSIKSGDKIRYVLLKTPNPMQDPVIGFIGDFPKEFELVEYIDKKAMFDKAFLKPLGNFLSCIDWKSKKEVSLEDFF